MPRIKAFQIETGEVVLPDSNGLLPIELSKLSTGLFTGGQITFGTLSGSPLTTTKISVSAGSGIIVDNYTDPENPTYELVSWGAFTDVEVTNIATADRTFVAIDITGSPSPNILQQTTDYTHAQRRDFIILGTVGHANRVNVVAVRNDPIAAFDVTTRLADLGNALGAFNVTGNIYGPNDSNLNIDKSAGESYRIGTNFHTTKASPDITTDAAETALEWNYSYRGGPGSPNSGYTLTAATDTIDPDNYDDGSGTLVAVTATYWTIQIIKHFPGGAGTRIEYGQSEYDTSVAALAAVPDINHQHNPAFIEGIIRGYLVVQEAATNLSTTAEAYFIEAAKFTGTGAALAVTALADLTDVGIDATGSPIGIGPADNDILAYDKGAAAWKNQTAAQADLATATDFTAHTGDSTIHFSVLEGLSDVVITPAGSPLGSPLQPADNDVLAYDVSSGNWINQTAAEANLATATDLTTVSNDLTTHTGDSTIHFSDLDGLADVVITPTVGSPLEPVDGQVLTYDSGTSKWINETPVTGAATLNELTDVTITVDTGSPLAIADNAVLAYDETSGNWINQTAGFAGLAVPSTLGNLVTQEWKIYDAANPANTWQSIAWSPELGLFAAVSIVGTGDRVMTSPDGITWTSRVSPADLNWSSITWSPELSLFAAVAYTATGSPQIDNVMTSPDGITWTLRTGVANLSWLDIVWSPELSLFVAVAADAVGSPQVDNVMTSPDGINWTLRSGAANNFWYGLAWSPELGLFAAVAQSGVGNRVMTSPDGINWTIRTSAANNQWYDIAWSPELGLFAACGSAGGGINTRIMTSPDGINWSTQDSSAGGNNQWYSIDWSPELGIFVACGAPVTGNYMLVSSDGINWTTQPTDGSNLQEITWSPDLGIFASVGWIGATRHVVTSFNPRSVLHSVDLQGISDTATTTQLTITDASSTFDNRIIGDISEKLVSVTTTTTYDADLTTGSVFELTLNGDTSITISGVPVAASPNILSTTVTFLLIQDAVGSPELGTRTPSFPASVKWEGGTVPTWTTVAGAVDIVTMFTVDAGVTWYANLVGQGYA